MTRRADSYELAIADIHRAIEAMVSDAVVEIAKDTGREAEKSARQAGVLLEPIPEKPNLAAELESRIAVDIGGKASAGVTLATLTATSPLLGSAAMVLWNLLALYRGQSNRLGRLKRQLELEVAATRDGSRMSRLDDDEKLRLLAALEALRTLLLGMRNADRRRVELRALRERYEMYLASNPPSYLEPTVDRALHAINDSLASG